MKTKLASYVLLYCALWPLSLSAQPPAVSGYNLSWFDEFDGPDLNTGAWTPSFTTNPTNNSLHAYLPSQVSVNGGNLVITSENVPFQNQPYRSGLVESTNAQRFGRWEVRAKLPTSTGMWPAIWLLPNVSQHPWPSGGEIDIMENRGDEPRKTSSAFHYGTNPPFSHSFRFAEHQAITAGEAVNFHESFHTYATEWDSEQIRFYVDDVHYYTIYDEDVGGFISGSTAPMHLVINTAVGGDFLTNPNASTVWPQQFLIDHVYVYEPHAGGQQLTFENGGFDEQGGSLARWSTFGNRLPNVQAGVEAVRDGSGSLKLFGQFVSTTSFSGIEQGISVSAGEEIRGIVESFIRSADSIAGTNNTVFMNVDYYSKTHGRFGTGDYVSSDSILVADGASPNDAWQMHELRATVPDGAVEARLALVFAQPNNQAGAVHIDNVLFGRAGDYTLAWDENGDGLWNDSRWTGALAVPTDFDQAIIRTNRVTVTSGQAFATTVESGILDVSGTLQSPQVMVAAAGHILGEGAIQGDLAVAGKLLLEGVQTLSVSQTIELEPGSDLALADSYDQTRGTLTGNFDLLSGANVSGTFETVGGAGVDSHLGHGFFLWDLEYLATDVEANVYAALMGDANGDGVVDASDFNIWNAHKFQSGAADWTQGDFNGDGFVDTSDFNLWNANKFTSIDVATVPEPSALCMLVMAVIPLLACVRPRRSADSSRFAASTTLSAD